MIESAVNGHYTRIGDWHLKGTKMARGKIRCPHCGREISVTSSEQVTIRCDCGAEMDVTPIHPALAGRTVRGASNEAFRAKATRRERATLFVILGVVAAGAFVIFIVLALASQHPTVVATNKRPRQPTPRDSNSPESTQGFGRDQNPSPKRAGSDEQNKNDNDANPNQRFIPQISGNEREPDELFEWETESSNSPEPETDDSKPQENTRADDPSVEPKTSKPVVRKLDQSGRLPDPDWDLCAKAIKDGIVRIIVTGTKGEQVVGTGFGVGDGTLVVTAEHAIRGNGDGQAVIEVEASDGRRLKAIPNSRMQHRDLAVLSIFGGGIKPLFLATDRQFIRTTPVLITGNGLALRDLGNHGELTGLDQWKQMNWRDSKSPLGNDTWLLKFSANVQPEHSGGPIVTPDGFVVGVNAFHDRADRSSNWAIHVNHVRELLGHPPLELNLPGDRLSTVEAIRIDRQLKIWASEMHKMNQKQVEERRRNAPPPQSPFKGAWDFYNGTLSENIRRQRSATQGR